MVAVLRIQLVAPPCGIDIRAVRFDLGHERPFIGESLGIVGSREAPSGSCESTRTESIGFAARVGPARLCEGASQGCGFFERLAARRATVLHRDDRQGRAARFDANAEYAPLNGADLSYVASTLSGRGAGLDGAADPEDRYYFGHHGKVPPLPVYRMMLRDGSDTRYYVDFVSGTLVAKIDRGAQAYRWWHEGLHRMDFTAALRRRPQWDAFTLLLMSGVTFVCATGAFMGYRRLVRQAL